MTLRTDITDAVKKAMIAKDERTVGTLRLVMAKMKDLDIAARPKGVTDGISEDEVAQMLQGMVKQRRESIALYEKGNRPDLVQLESDEITVIERFMPKQMSAEETLQAIKDTIAALGAKDIKDMGKVMAELKKNFAGKLDFSQAGGLVKTTLTG